MDFLARFPSLKNTNFKFKARMPQYQSSLSLPGPYTYRTGKRRPPQHTCRENEEIQIGRRRAPFPFPLELRFLNVKVNINALGKCFPVSHLLKIPRYWIRQLKELYVRRWLWGIECMLHPTRGHSHSTQLSCFLNM